MYNNVVMKIGFIGGGNMAEAMIKGMTSHGMKDILVYPLEYQLSITASDCLHKKKLQK